MIYLFLIFFILAAGYFALHHRGIQYALKEADLQLLEIKKDLSQNQILHMALPDKDLEHLMHSFNELLEDMQRERQNYEKRERAFQRQIEDISHDLRTPLTVILGYLKFIRKSDYMTQMPKELKEDLKIIERKARSMETLVTEFYDFSQLISREYKFILQQTDLCRILREALLDNYQILEQSHLSITSTLPNHPVMVLGDCRGLERIFSNLFQNTGRYANSFLHIQLEEYREKSRVTVTFTNDTKKPLPQDISHLFERFYMQESVRNQESTGLGLTIAKSLAEAMQGTLIAEARSSTILRLILTLPAFPAEMPQ
ncbi:MAG: HAMP domain-containing histidine kinase [Lachnospiraceae bacterium]|nr:HAMP domain-containing histidine kinase [Lachnospiraceae bacterium]